MEENLISKKELLERYGIETSGKKCVILGRSNIVGKPMAQLMMQKQYGDAETLITERVELILSGKNELELDELARKLRGEEKEAWVLLLGTSYGDKRFQLEEVKRILRIRGETQKDVTALVMEQSKEA